MAELNMDCVRDILLFLEENQRYKASGKIFVVKMKRVYPHFQNYSYEEQYEAAKYLGQKKLVTYVDGMEGKQPRQYVCNGITPEGHKFIAAIKDDTLWKKLCKHPLIATLSVSEIIQIAATLIG